MTDTPAHPAPSGRTEDEQFAPSLSLTVQLTALALTGGGLILSWLGVLPAIQWWLSLQQAVPGAFADVVAGMRNAAVVIATICLVLGAAQVYAGVRMFLCVRRGRVSLRASGIEIVDWRGRARAIGWGEIEQIRVITWGGLWRPPKASITTKRGTWSIPPYVRERDRLLADMVGRSGLREKQRNWLRRRYAR